MKSRTYYEILGVSRDASIEEITIAKNALAKVYHPDANAHKNLWICNMPEYNLIIWIFLSGCHEHTFGAYVNRCQ